MKRALTLAMTFALALCGFSACGRLMKDPDAKSGSESVIVSAIKDNKSLQLKETVQKEAADMTDLEALYAFVRQDYPDLLKSSFSHWFTYFMYPMDITGDGTNELLFDVMELGDMLIISGDTGEYKKITSNIHLYKYGTVPSLQDGFLVVKGTTGGTGVQYTEMNLYLYRNGGLQPVLEGLPILNRVTGEALSIEETGTLEGSLTDFIYTYKQYDAENDRYNEQKARYIWHPDEIRFEIQPVEVPKTVAAAAEEAPPAWAGDISKYVGMDIAPETVLPDGITDMGGWVQTEDMKYCIGIMEREGFTMLWLEELTRHDSEGRAYFKVLDVILLPKIEGAVLCHMTADTNGGSMYGPFGLARHSDTEFFETVYHVYDIDVMMQKIIEIPADGYKGINEGYGL